MKVTSRNDNSSAKFVNKNMTTTGYLDGNVNQELNHAVFSLNQVSLNKQGCHLSSCSDEYTGLQKWGIYYQAALRSQGQYKDEVFVVDDGTLRKLTVECPVSLAKSSKSFLHYGGEVLFLGNNACGTRTRISRALVLLLVARERYYSQQH